MILNFRKSNVEKEYGVHFKRDLNTEFCIEEVFELYNYLYSNL